VLLLPGMQYASRDYTALLIEHDIRHEPPGGDPYDNAVAESFIQKLKYEEVYRQEYRDWAEAREAIPRFLEQGYNEKRMHSASAYLPSAEFERTFAPAFGTWIAFFRNDTARRF
jgi:putative transposase